MQSKTQKPPFKIVGTCKKPAKNARFCALKNRDATAYTRVPRFFLALHG
jgi:hypothetical protein